MKTQKPYHSRTAINRSPSPSLETMKICVYACVARQYPILHLFIVNRITHYYSAILTRRAELTSM